MSMEEGCDSSVQAYVWMGSLGVLWGSHLYLIILCLLPTKQNQAEPGDDAAVEVENVDSEERAEEEQLTALTLKYSGIDDEEEVMLVNKARSPSPENPADDSDVGKSDEEKLAEQRRAQIEADLLEISRIIESKEELISQLQCSQAKYSVSSCLLD
jgi:hypothetical protein